MSYLSHIFFTFGISLSIIAQWRLIIGAKTNLLNPLDWFLLDYQGEFLNSFVSSSKYQSPQRSLAIYSWLILDLEASLAAIPLIVKAHPKNPDPKAQLPLSGSIYIEVSSASQ